MWQRFTWYDVRVIGHYLGMLVLFSSVALIVPLVTAIVFREWTPASHYLLSIGLSLIVGSALRFLRIEPGRLNRQQALAVTEKGKATPDEFDINAFTPGMVTVMIGLAMMVVFYLLRERQR